MTSEEPAVRSIATQTADDAVSAANSTIDRTQVRAGGSGGFLSSLTSGDNQLMTAGLSVMVFGAGLAILRGGLKRGASFAKEAMLVTLEIPSRDRSYSWFLGWMGQQQQHLAQSGSAGGVIEAGTRSAVARTGSGGGILYMLRDGLGPKLRSHHFAVETQELAKEKDTEATVKKQDGTRFALVPGPGKHLLRYNGCLIQVDRKRDGKLVDLSSGMPWETVTLTTLYRDRAVFGELLHEARRAALQMKEGKTTVYTAMMTEWRPFGKPRARRPIDSVVLAPGVKERILDDVKDFLNSRAWYRARGVPYRRGYLLHGPPGSGKTSFINALAGELGYDICVLNLSERGLTDDRLNHLLQNVPQNAVVLLEDIDAAFGGRRPEEFEGTAGASGARQQSQERGFAGSNVTFSGLLNALDGVASSEERLTFLTTNHPELLDPALIRPGRVDMREYLGDAADEQVKSMFTRFYGDVVPDKTDLDVLAQSFLQRVRAAGQPVSPAQLQGMFVYCKDSPQAAVNMAHVFAEQEREAERLEKQG
ncbi:Complex III assembly protein translocase and chaperone [Savitreella phatthalungensis]